MSTPINITHQALGREFWIAHGLEAVHYGQLAPGEALSSGLPDFEVFSAEAETDWRARLAEMGHALPDPPADPLPPWLARPDEEVQPPIPWQL